MPGVPKAGALLVPNVDAAVLGVPKGAVPAPNTGVDAAA